MSQIKLRPLYVLFPVISIIVNPRYKSTCKKIHDLFGGLIYSSIGIREYPFPKNIKALSNGQSSSEAGITFLIYANNIVGTLMRRLVHLKVLS